MANTIKHKRGSGSDPTASDLVVGELAIRTDTGVVFTKKDDNSVAQIAGGGDTDLGVSTTTTAVTVTSSTGNNATISEASSSAAGVMSAAHHDKLDGIATGAEVNVGTDLSFSKSGTQFEIRSSTGTNVDIVAADSLNAGIFTSANFTKLSGIETGATADQTATEILTALKTVDGAGSGLDADTLDGVSSGSFIRSDADDTVTGHTEWQDNKEVRLGNSADLKLYHDGTDSYIDGGTGDTYIRGNGDDLYLRAADDVFIQTQNGETAAKFIGNGAVELNYDNSQKFATKSDGVDITGELQCDSLDVDGSGDISGNLTLHGNLDMQDNDSILIGTSDDLQLFHNGSNSYIDNNTSDLYIRQLANDRDIYIQSDNGSGGVANYIYCDGSSGEVILGHYGTAKLTTKSTGVEFAGSLDIDENIRHKGDTNNYIGFPAADTFRVVTGGTERFRITSTGAIAIEGSSNYGTSGQVLTSNGNDAPTWQDGGGTVASGCVYENSQTISANYSVTSGKNAMSAGPITIASGVTVTVTSGSTYTIV